MSMSMMTMGWMFVLILLLFVSQSTCDDDVWFQLRHRDTTLYPPSIMAYVGQPPRIQPIRLTWTPPGAAKYPETPAIYSALWVDETNLMAQQDQIRLLTREIPVWFMVQTMPTDSDLETFLELYMSHDSILYQRWSHSVLTYDQLHLTRRDSYVAGPRSVVWPCDEYDTHHRCVVHNVTFHLMYNNAKRPVPILVMPRVVLDWDNAQSQVPPWMYGALRYGQFPANLNTQNRLTGVKLVDTWLLQDSDVTIDDSEPIVAAGPSSDNDTIVLGRRLLWRTFNVFAFDGHAEERGVWTLNRVQSGYDAIVILLQLSVIIQSIFLAYHSTGTSMLSLDRIIKAHVKDLDIFEPSALTIRDRVVIGASVAIAVFQIVSSVWATGSGPYTDRDLATYLGRLAWIIMAVGGLQIACGLVFYGLNKKLEPGHTRGMLHILTHSSYIKLALLGELTALLPDSVQSKYFLLAAVLVALIYVIPSFAYTSLCLFVTGAAQVKRVGYLWASGLVEILATLTLTSGIVVYLFRPTCYQHQILFDQFPVWCIAIIMGGLALLIPTMVVFIQVYKGIMSHEKVKVT